VLGERVPEHRVGWGALGVEDGQQELSLVHPRAPSSHRCGLEGRKDSFPAQALHDNITGLYEILGCILGYILD
jgi:hypothetical protein